MTTKLRTFSLTAAVLLLAGHAVTTSADSVTGGSPTKAQITVLYDAFGKDSTLQKDWGYAALIEYGG